MTEPTLQERLRGRAEAWDFETPGDAYAAFIQDVREAADALDKAEQRGKELAELVEHDEEYRRSLVETQEDMLEYESRLKARLALAERLLRYASVPCTCGGELGHHDNCDQEALSAFRESEKKG